MLIDRACPGGGWNAGNGVVYGTALAPHPDDTAIALLALSDRGQHPIVQSSIQYLERLAPTLTAPWSLAGQFSRSPRTAGRLLCFTVLLLHFLISSSIEDTSTLALVCLALIRRAVRGLRSRHCEPYPSRLSNWQRGSGGWHDGHCSFPSAQVSFGSTTEAISSCDPPCAAILPTARPDPRRGSSPLPDRRPRQDGGPQAQLSRLHSWQRHQYPSIAGPRCGRIISPTGC